MKKRLLALALVLTMCFGTTMTANAAMNISNKMGALDTHNILDENSSKIPKGTLQYMASKFKIEYTQEDLKALKKIFDANLYAKAYPDVAAAYGNDREALWNHYVTHGIKEGRTQINSGFNVFAYISAYPDLRNAFGDDLVAYYVHYANNGINENRKFTTVDAATRAGITVTGLQGQVIARPAPIQVPDLSSYSVPSSVPKADTVIDTPKATTQPTETPKQTEDPSPSVTPTPTPTQEPAPSETPKPSEAPSPSVTPTPTPTPEVPSEPTSCNHSYTLFEAIESQAHFHYAKCKECDEYEKGPDGSKLPLECIYENSVCRDCNRPCNHDNFDGMKQIDGTTIHGPLCKICGYVDTEKAQACKADDFDPVNDAIHNVICKECGGVIRSEDHQYTYTYEKAEDGTPIHKGTCSTCQNNMEGPCKFAEGSNECTVCHNRHTEHQWDSSDGHCKFCGVTCWHEWEDGKCKVCGKTCDHPSQDKDGTCTVCGYHIDSTSGMFENSPE